MALCQTGNNVLPNWHQMLMCMYNFLVRNASVWSMEGSRDLTWWRHQMETFSGLLALFSGNLPVTGEFPSQRPVTQSVMFSLICTWINGWVNNRDAGDFRRHRTHYDVTVMLNNIVWSTKAYTNHWLWEEYTCLMLCDHDVTIWYS